MSLPSKYNNKKKFFYGSSKKRTFSIKKAYSKNIWKRKEYLAALKAFSLAKYLSPANSKSFCCATN